MTFSFPVEGERAGEPGCVCHKGYSGDSCKLLKEGLALGEAKLGKQLVGRGPNQTRGKSKRSEVVNASWLGVATYPRCQQRPVAPPAAAWRRIRLVRTTHGAPSAAQTPRGQLARLAAPQGQLKNESPPLPTHRHPLPQRARLLRPRRLPRALLPVRPWLGRCRLLPAQRAARHPPRPAARAAPRRLAVWRETRVYLRLPAADRDVPRARVPERHEAARAVLRQPRVHAAGARNPAGITLRPLQYLVACGAARLPSAVREAPPAQPRVYSAGV